MLKIAVISPNKAHMEEIRKILQSGDIASQVLLFEGGLEQASLIAGQEHPALIIVDDVTHGMKEFSVLEALRLGHPDLAIVILTENTSPEFLMAAIRSGVSDVLHLPLTAPSLKDAVQRVENKLKQAVSPDKAGKVVAFISGKGGGGATFLACNLSYILAEVYQEKVALLDLHMQFGDAALFVSDLIPANSIADVAGNITRLDASFLASSMVQVLPNFLVLAAPQDAESADEIKPEHVEAIIKLAQSQFDYVLLDMGPAVNAISVKALDLADKIFIVLQETLPFIRDSKKLIQLLQSLGYPNEKIHLIVNRYKEGGDIQLADVESTLGIRVLTTIPNSYTAVSSSVNQGVPILKIFKHDPVTKALDDLAKTMASKPAMKNNSWFYRLFHHA
jgi:pilus assembly protein CpaE